MSLLGKKSLVVVTGASSGIGKGRVGRGEAGQGRVWLAGREIAVRLAREVDEGSNFLLTARRLPLLQETADEIEVLEGDREGVEDVGEVAEGGAEAGRAAGAAGPGGGGKGDGGFRGGRGGSPGGHGLPPHLPQRRHPRRPDPPGPPAPRQGRHRRVLSGPSCPQFLLSSNRTLVARSGEPGLIHPPQQRLLGGSGGLDGAQAHR